MTRYSILAVVVVASYLFSLGANGDTLVLGSTIFDQAPNYRTHKNFPSNYWTCAYQNYPLLGSVGTANGGQGWPNTDFELPEWQYGQATHNPNSTSCPEANSGLELGMVGPVCNITNKFQNCATLGSNSIPNYIYPGMSPLGSVGSPQSFANWWLPNEQVVAIGYNLTLNSIGQNTYQYNNSLFFPIDGRGWNDSGYCDTDGLYHNFGFCLTIHGYFTYDGGETFSFTGDDDLWVYLDQRLVIDLGGPHVAYTSSVSLDQIASVGGWLQLGFRYDFDMFYCERHTTNSELALTTSINIQCTYYDWCGACEGNGQSCCTAASLALCNDSNACTIDTCAVLVPPTTSCQHTPVNCDVDPGNQCYNFGCNNATGCTVTAISCDDHDACTLDTCVNATGCSNVPITCPGNLCNTSQCNKLTGCFTTPVSCTAPDACHTAKCDPLVYGCQITPIACNGGNACTNTTCDPIKGCQYPSIVCDDQNACTENNCNPSSGCSFPTITCNAGNACTNNTCDVVKGCQYQNISSTCNDGNSCTQDSCDPTSGCHNLPIDCTGSNACLNYSCNPSIGCVNTAIPECGCASVTCNSTDLCNPITCNPSTGQCTVVNHVNCNDGNPCTNDSCSAGVCNNPAVNCTDNDLCTVDSCSATNGSCLHIQVFCNDNNACTQDSCVQGTGNCSFISVAGNCVPCGSVACTWTDPCNPQVCVAGQCVTSPYPCVASNKCSTLACANVGGNATCVPSLISCASFSTGSECINATCDPLQGCINGPDLCANSNPCLSVSCVGPNTCNTSVSDICDDNDICTVDTCNGLSGSANCTYKNLSCPAPDICSVYVGCNSSTTNSSDACVYQPIVCPNSTLTDWCLLPFCDDTIGCTNYSRGCVNPDRDCYTTSCSSSMQKCIVTELPDWTTITTSKKGGKTCFLAYDTAAAVGIIAGGVIAGIVIGAVVVAALAAVAGRKAYLYMQLRQGGMGPASGNPLYHPSSAGGENPLFRS